MFSFFRKKESIKEAVIVKFLDGSFGVRRGDHGDFEYLDSTGTEYWWNNNINLLTRYKTKSDAEKRLVDISDFGTPVEN
jgi:hypothetical protein